MKLYKYIKMTNHDDSFNVTVDTKVFAELHDACVYMVDDMYRLMHGDLVGDEFKYHKESNYFSNDEMIIHYSLNKYYWYIVHRISTGEAYITCSIIEENMPTDCYTVVMHDYFSDEFTIKNFVAYVDALDFIDTAIHDAFDSFHIPSEAVDKDNAIYEGDRYKMQVGADWFEVIDKFEFDHRVWYVDLYKNKI